MSNTKQNPKSLRFASINKRIEQNIVLPTETSVSGGKFIQWGDKNAYPDYLLHLYRNCATLRSVINGAVDYVCGDDIQSVTMIGKRINRAGDTKASLVEALARDYFTFGGFALEVVRNHEGNVAEVSALPMQYLRSDKFNESFMYCEDWAKRKNEAEVLPKFVPYNTETVRSVFFYKNATCNTYPEPIYAASIKPCEIECNIDNYHLNAISNGFAGSFIVNFNNGVPDDETKDEIERAFNSKFAGSENAGRIAFCWNENKESATTLDKLEVDNFGDRYSSLAKHSRQQIFTAFRANPNLFGIPTDSLGFSSEEYESAFKLFNRTIIRPAQKRICDALDEIFGVEGALTIKPFTLEGETEKTVQ